MNKLLLDEYLLVFHYGDDEYSVKQYNDINTIERAKFPVQILLKRIQDGEEDIPVPSFMLIAAYVDAEPVVVAQVQGYIDKEELTAWVEDHIIRHKGLN